MTKKRKNTPKGKRKSANSTANLSPNIQIQQTQSSLYNTTNYVRAFISKAWTWLLTIASIIGFTINIRPDTKIELKTPNDPSKLIFKVSNDSWVPSNNLIVDFYVDTLQTTQNERIGSLKFTNIDAAYPQLKRGNSFSSEYDMRVLFGYDPPPYFVQARVAVQVTYDYWDYSQTETVYYKGFFNSDGTYLWSEMPDAGFVEKIDTLKTPTNYYDIPELRRNFGKKLKDPRHFKIEYK
jgi:hypothetical protein